MAVGTSCVVSFRAFDTSWRMVAADVSGCHSWRQGCAPVAPVPDAGRLLFLGPGTRYRFRWGWDHSRNP